MSRSQIMFERKMILVFLPLNNIKACMFQNILLSYPVAHFLWFLFYFVQTSKIVNANISSLQTDVLESKLE